MAITAFDIIELEKTNTTNVTINYEKIFNQTIYFLHKYYPIKHFNNSTLDQVSVDFRNDLFKFKDGTSQSVTKKFSNEVIYAINHIALITLRERNFNQLDYAFLAVPASSENKTIARYTLLLETLKQKFPKMTFVNDYITFNGERQAKHLSATPIQNLSSHFNIEGGVQGKRVIIFDDITTTGKSMIDMKSRLHELGAKDCIFLSLGRTVDYRKF